VHVSQGPYLSDAVAWLPAARYGLGAILASWRRRLRSSSNRAVASRMIAAMPIISPESPVNGTIVNATEICVPSFRIAGTESVWPSL
jgi:hypothetical protein